jgi:hypothetical protein
VGEQRLEEAVEVMCVDFLECCDIRTDAEDVFNDAPATEGEVKALRSRALEIAKARV